MVISLIGTVIGALITAFGLYYLVKDWKDQESKKIYGIISGIGSVIFIAMLVKLKVGVL
ncbi:MAG: hypothetical protein LIO81_03505 [Clostridiales bacterium]|nr:hypothetical protein [Clostridiales bacterium]